VIIFYILTTLSLDNVWTLLGENCCWSLLGLKGLRKKNKFGLSLFIPAWKSQIFTVKIGGKRSPFLGKCYLISIENCLLPHMLINYIRLKPQSNYNLRSNTKQYLLLDLPNKTEKTTGDRAFFAATPTLWNTLPDELRALGSLKTFMARLIPHYFKLAFTL